MSQHDMDIANATHSSLRADLNAALVAMVSQSSGATAPATTFAYQFWADTTTGILKQRNAANNAWISVLTLSTGKVATAAAADTANQVDSGEVTVTAHATTGNIFAAAANSILWDDSGGAITTTIFPNAAKAGMIRDLRLNGASKFVAGANLLIEGIPSGKTITLAAGALVQVRAITTTQFKMTYSVSGTFTATGTGFTANPTGTAKYRVQNGAVTLTLPFLSGTSNAATFTITGLPAVIVPLFSQSFIFRGTDASTTAACTLILDNGVNSYNTAAGLVGNETWTASGTKSFSPTTISYGIV